MPFNALSSGISATSDFVTTLMNNAAQRRANKKNYQYQTDLNKQQWQYQRDLNAQANQYNLEMAEYTYKKNLEQWNRENVYNSPKSQMQRYKDAGLNPHLIYGQQNTASGSPQMQTPQGQFNAPNGIVAPRHEAVKNAFTNIGQYFAQYQDLISQQEDNKAKQLANERTEMERPYWAQDIQLGRWREIFDVGNHQEDYYNRYRSNKVNEFLEGFTRNNIQMGEDIFKSPVMTKTDNFSYNNAMRSLNRIGLGLDNTTKNLLNEYQSGQNNYQNSFLEFQNKMLKEKTDLLDKLTKGNFADLNDWQTNMRLMGLSLFDQSVSTMYGRELDAVGNTIGNVFGGIGKLFKGFRGAKKADKPFKTGEVVDYVRDKNGNIIKADKTFQFY